MSHGRVGQVKTVFRHIGLLCRGGWIVVTVNLKFTQGGSQITAISTVTDGKSGVNQTNAFMNIPLISCEREVVYNVVEAVLRSV